jgi:hypothetical protein
VSDDWTAALDAFEASVAAFEQRTLDRDVDALPGPWVPPADVAALPSSAERSRALGLLARARACEERLAGLLHEVAEELHGLRARSDAAARYQGTRHQAAGTT